MAKENAGEEWSVSGIVDADSVERCATGAMQRGQSGMLPPASAFGDALSLALNDNA